MAIQDIMTSRVVTVHMDDPLSVIRDIFASTTFHHLLVVEENSLKGVISDRDLLKALSPFVDTHAERQRDRATLDRKAYQIMTRDLITIGPNNSITSAITLFNRHRISCLPVVDASHTPLGIVTWRDILRYAEKQVQIKKAEE